MLEAEMKLDQGLAAEALADIAALRKEAGAHTAALRLELRALRAAGRHAEIPALVDQLVKRKVYGAEEGNLIRAAAHAEALKALASDPQGLRAYWGRLSDAERTLPRVAGAAATQLPRSSAATARRRTSSRTRFAPTGSRRCVAIYADCRVPEPDAPARAGRALARRAQPGRGAAPRAGRAVRAAAAVGQGADVPRGEPRARRHDGARTSRWASCSRASAATARPMRTSARRSSSRWPAVGRIASAAAVVSRRGACNAHPTRRCPTPRRASGLRFGCRPRR